MNISVYDGLSLTLIEKPTPVVDPAGVPSAYANIFDCVSSVTIIEVYAPA